MWEWWVSGWPVPPAPMNAVTMLLIVLLTFLVYRHLVPGRNYWSRLGVEHRPFRFPFGSRGPAMLFYSYADLLRSEYEEVKQAGGVRLHMDITGPAATICDLDLLRNVLITDFDHFTDRQPPSRRIGYHSKMMMNKPGEEWRRMRNIMTPTFTAAKMRAMVSECEVAAGRLARQLLARVDSEGSIEMGNLFGRYTMDNIAAVAFGIDSRCTETPDSIILQKAEKMVARPSPLSLFFRVSAVRIGIGKLYDRLLSAITSKEEDPFAFFVGLAEKAIEHRRKDKETRKNDYLQLLLDHRDEDGQPIPDDDIVANCVMFFMGGFETTATTLSWATRCLAFDAAVQRRLQQEVDAAVLVAQRDGARTSWSDRVSSLPYLDALLRETLRLYPAATPQISRCVTKPYRLPHPAVTLPQHSTVYLPVFGIHRDPDLYPDPERFDPERFSVEQRRSRHPCAWLPFGLGPRKCVADRFALLEAKLALAELVKHVEFVQCPRSGDQRPVFLAGFGPVRERGGTWLGVRKRQPTK